MASRNIPNKILNWYDNNKRELPWRKPKTLKQSQYFTLVSEIMLQQTQVKTVIPYFERFINEIPTIEKLSKIKKNKLLKLWEGLGYYSRVLNLKKTANLLIKKFDKKLPNTIEDLKQLPGIGDYTSRAILALEYNKKVIPLDGNIERLLKRNLFLRKEHEINKKNLMSKINYFGNSYRQRDYVQALMELGALICKPIDPMCNLCPISNNCKSFKKKDFKIIKKIRKNNLKYFKVNILKNQNKILLIKNVSFNFLKNHLIFPMKEIKEKDYKLWKKKKIKIKISNIDMKIIVSINKKMPKKTGQIIHLNKINNSMVPSFTKKILSVALN